MKRFYTLFVGLLLSSMSFAQLPDGSIAPNFSGMTIDSQAFDLYELLDAGKPVIIDVSATWCGPCWNYHNTKALENLYKDHGPAGDNKVGVIFVEGDPSTAVACLYGPGTPGCTGTTQGNWTLNTSYPILDDGTGDINDAFQIGYFPTVYRVCPDRTIVEAGQITAAAHWAGAQTCKTAVQGTDAGIASFKAGTEITAICNEAQVEPTFYLINYGSAPMTSATITLSHNSTVLETINWVGSVNTYGNVPVAFNPATITDIGDLVVSVTNINGAGDDLNMADNTKKVTFTAAPEVDKYDVLVKLKTDNYGAELYWEMRDGDGDVFAKGGNEAVGPNGGGQYANAPASTTAYGNNQTKSIVVTLPSSGCYLFHVVDAYGDGVCCDYGTGYVRLFDTDDLINPLINLTSFVTAQRPYGTSAAFSGVDNIIPSNSLNVFPNPVKNMLTVDFSVVTRAEVGLRITNALGQTVQNFAPTTMVEGNHQMSVSVSDLADGLYFVSLVTNEGVATRSFTVAK